MLHEFQITSYCDESGKDHFSEWFHQLDWQTQNIVLARLNRVKLGNLGDYKSLGEKLYELRIHVGCGYRIYFAKEENYVVLLLCAGSKFSQKKDIQKAKNFLQIYSRRPREKNKN